MEVQIKKIILIAISLFSLILTGCSRKIDKSKYVAKVNDRFISKEVFEKELSFYQKFYLKKNGSNFLNEDNKENDLEKSLLDSLIKDQIMLIDLNEKGIEISKNDSSNLIESLSKKIGDEESLIANLKSFGSDESEFSEITFNDSIRKKHWEYFLNNYKVNDEDIVEFLNSNKNFQKQYKYDLLIFDDETEAKKIRDDIKKYSDFKEYLQSPIRNYKVFRSDFTYINDEILKKSKISEKSEVSKIIKEEDKYYILAINSTNTEKKDLLIKTKELYIKNKYDQYLKNILEDANIRVFI